MQTNGIKMGILDQKQERQTMTGFKTVWHVDNALRFPLFDKTDKMPDLVVYFGIEQWKQKISTIASWVEI
jgi:hypothetical protein